MALGAARSSRSFSKLLWKKIVPNRVEFSVDNDQEAGSTKEMFQSRQRIDNYWTRSSKKFRLKKMMMMTVGFQFYG